MDDCINKGLKTGGILPGGLNVRRRAQGIYDALNAEHGQNQTAPHVVNDWIATYAMAVNEQQRGGCPRGNRPHERRGGGYSSDSAVL